MTSVLSPFPSVISHRGLRKDAVSCSAQSLLRNRKDAGSGCPRWLISRDAHCTSARRSALQTSSTRLVPFPRFPLLWAGPQHGHSGRPGASRELPLFSCSVDWSVPLFSREAEFVEEPRALGAAALARTLALRPGTGRGPRNQPCDPGSRCRWQELPSAPPGDHSSPSASSFTSAAATHAAAGATRQNRSPGQGPGGGE